MAGQQGCWAETEDPGDQSVPMKLFAQLLGIGVGSEQRPVNVSREISSELYGSVVRSLHGDVQALFLGMFATWIGIALIFYHLPVWPIAAIGGLAVLVGLIRMVSVLKFRKRYNVGPSSPAPKPASRREMVEAERAYNFQASAYVFLLGVLCFVTMEISDDNLVHLVAFTVTLAYIIGIAGRNYASALVVNSQVIAICLPLVSGLLLFGNATHVILALLLCPFLLAQLSIARRLRDMLTGAVFMAAEKKVLADRFEIALKHASHGMAMVDRNGVFVVANQRFNELAGIGADFNIIASRFSRLIDKENSHGNKKSSGLFAQLEVCLGQTEHKRFQFHKKGSTAIEASFNPMPEGGGVFVLEDISERLKSEIEIRQLANFDPLTHLFNRRHFTQVVKQRFRGKKDEPKPYALFFIDLDDFKQINDTLGHAVGDKLIRSVGERMRNCLPDDGLICRFGGDEFVLVLPDGDDQAHSARFAEQMIEAISKPSRIEGNLITAESSIGISLCPDDHIEFEQLLKMADAALYEAKKENGSAFAFYTDAIGQRIKERRNMEVDLRRAVEEGELSVHFQPLIDVETHEIAGCEALIRWFHPEKGAISPGLFIPLAEEIGLISKIGQFVLEEATKNAASWPDQICVAVNMSSLQFKRSNVVKIINNALSKSGLAAGRLELEITESAAIEDLEETSRILQRLSHGGIKIALDDFGTGFSSLSYLSQLPLDKVKIDRSFMESIDEDEKALTLLSGICRLASDLGLKVIIEGVEEEGQFQFLREKVLVDQVQGFLFGQPLSGDEISQLIANWPSKSKKPTSRKRAGPASSRGLRQKRIA